MFSACHRTALCSIRYDELHQFRSFRFVLRFCLISCELIAVRRSLVRFVLSEHSLSRLAYLERSAFASPGWWQFSDSEISRSQSSSSQSRSSQRMQYFVFDHPQMSGQKVKRYDAAGVLWSNCQTSSHPKRSKTFCSSSELVGWRDQRFYLNYPTPQLDSSVCFNDCLLTCLLESKYQLNLNRTRSIEFERNLYRIRTDQPAKFQPFPLECIGRTSRSERIVIIIDHRF